jgi:hypothetical protein
MPCVGEKNGEPLGNSMSSPRPASDRPGLAYTSSRTPHRSSTRRMYQSQPAAAEIPEPF